VHANVICATRNFADIFSQQQIVNVAWNFTMGLARHRAAD
jgi:hypothetical protein